MTNNVKIIGTGKALPEKILTNIELEKSIDSTNEWILNNLGIYERRISNYNETSSYLGSIAAKHAMINANLNEEDIDMIIVATTSPDKISPSTACIIKDILNLPHAVAFDIAAVCSGFLFSMSIAEKYISSGMYKNILVVGADIFSKITDWSNRNSVFFGDGAGAVVMARSNEQGFINFSLFSDSTDNMGFFCNLNEKFNMNTKSVFNIAVEKIPYAINDVLSKSNMTIDDIDYFLPHQPSIKILKEVAKRINLPENKLMYNMKNYGNTVSATIPILLDETWPRLKKNDLLLFASIGSGWTYGASIYKV